MVGAVNVQQQQQQQKDDLVLVLVYGDNNHTTGLTCHTMPFVSPLTDIFTITFPCLFIADVVVRSHIQQAFKDCPNL